MDSYHNSLAIGRGEDLCSRSLRRLKSEGTQSERNSHSINTERKAREILYTANAPGYFSDSRTSEMDSRTLNQVLIALIYFILLA